MIVRGHGDSHQRCASADQAQFPLAMLQRSDATAACSQLGAHENTPGQDFAADVRQQSWSEHMTSVNATGVTIQNTATDCIPSECSSRRMRKMHRSKEEVTDMAYVY